MIGFLDCKIELLQDGVYELTHCSGAKWYPKSLLACQEAAVKTWVLNHTQLAVAINKQGWCIANRYALELGWPYSLYRLYPNQMYCQITKLPDAIGVWRDIAYQKVLLGDKEVVLIESLEQQLKR